MSNRFWSRMLRRWLPVFAAAHASDRWPWPLWVLAALIEYADPAELQHTAGKEEFPQLGRADADLARLDQATPVQLEAALHHVSEEVWTVYKASLHPPGVGPHLTNKKAGRKRKKVPAKRRSTVWRWTET